MTLPVELWCEIAERCDLRSLSRLSETSRTLHNICEENGQWKARFTRSFPSVARRLQCSVGWKDRFRRRHCLDARLREWLWKTATEFLHHDSGMVSGDWVEQEWGADLGVEEDRALLWDAGVAVQRRSEWNPDSGLCELFYVRQLLRHIAQTDAIRRLQEWHRSEAPSVLEGALIVAEFHRSGGECDEKLVVESEVARLATLTAASVLAANQRHPLASHRTGFNSFPSFSRSGIFHVCYLLDLRGAEFVPAERSAGSAEEDLANTGL